MNKLEKKLLKTLRKLADLLSNELARKDHDHCSLQALADDYEYLSDEIRELANRLKK